MDHRHPVLPPPSLLPLERLRLSLQLVQWVYYCPFTDYPIKCYCQGQKLLQTLRYSFYWEKNVFDTNAEDAELSIVISSVCWFWYTTLAARNPGIVPISSIIFNTSFSAIFIPWTISCCRLADQATSGCMKDLVCSLCFSSISLITLPAISNISRKLTLFSRFVKAWRYENRTLQSLNQ